MPISWLSRRRTAWAVGIVLVVGAAFALDDAAFRLAARPIKSGQLNTTLASLRCFGDGSPLILLTLIACAAAPHRRGAAVLALAAALLAGLVADQVKFLSARRRPLETLRAAGSESWGLADNNGRNSSFPSGHSATAFGFARGMSLAFPQIAPVAYAAAAGTGVSRMHALRHYLSDCIVGSLVGWGVATLLWRLAGRLQGRTCQRADDEDRPPVLPLPKSA